MRKKKNKKNGARQQQDAAFFDEFRLHPDTKKSIWAIVFIGISAILFLASFQSAGPVGGFFYRIGAKLFGWGYYLLPLICLIIAGVFLTSERRRIYKITFIGAAIFVLASLGLIDIILPGKSGLIGQSIGSIESLFGYTASIVIVIVMIIISFLITLNLPIKIKKPQKKEESSRVEEIAAAAVASLEQTTAIQAQEEPIDEKPKESGKKEAIKAVTSQVVAPLRPKLTPKVIKNYVPPPLDLLKSSVEKPTAGDLRANANIIKRTLESFGIPVEMGEINIGPKVTRYTLKPAEGVKLSRIITLNQDLALALAAHPIRIEAPIPGKSLVGIEVPNKAAALVRLGSLMAYPEFTSTGQLSFVLGRDVNGEPIFADIEKMPHLLIAGATGSGKSISLHALIVSLLYKNSPEMLKFILIDPKRVELSVYKNLPHLITPVIMEAKKAVAAFRWAINEMEKRYQLLLEAGARDIQSYNKKSPSSPLPYALIIIDELADLMAAYGREVEGSIIRLAQMARATGLHLIVSTQRPSVEVVTGLIKANITSRIALQVASQVDSRTILDTAGAEKLLGGGDMLFISSEFSKPKRIQGAYLSEEEVNKVANFIEKNNQSAETEEKIDLEGKVENNHLGADLDQYMNADEEDELFDEAVEVVRQAQKASASLLQRRLKVGYARAARLLDIMEEKGIIGPGEGAKPREVYLENKNDTNYK